jgi:Ca2+-binding RTX toxin-like protein
MRLMRLLVLALVPLGLVVLAHGPAAVAAPATCQGQPATITSDGGNVLGTEGDDVISTVGVVDIQALGGDDLICVERGTANAGGGNDSVQGTATSCCTQVTVNLGPGDDTYNGTFGSTSIDGDGSGNDTITTGIGDDRVISGAEGEPNLDVIDLGLGNDGLSVRLPDGSDVTASGGGGYDRISAIGAETAVGSWDLELSGTLGRDGDQLAVFSGFRGHYLAYGSPAHVAVTGTVGADIVTLVSGTFDVDLLGGDDGVSVYRYPGAVAGQIDTGDGRDTFYSYGSPVEADLGRGIVTLGTGSFQLTGVEHHTFEGRDVRVRGSRADDDIYVRGCHVLVQTLGGRDVIGYAPEEDADCDTYSVRLQGGGGRDLIRGSGRKERLEGGRGNDRLLGGKNGDTLIGGPGHDRADGGGGQDRCQAEKEKNCER